MKNEIEKNKTITANSEQIATLKAHFPNCFDAQGRFLPHKLEEIVKAEGADITREGYKLDWLGKSYARLLANLKTETLLQENKEHNAKPENTNSENLLIQGDNLDVLKHLKNAYSEKVKMIYIDPPYNTGSDGFVYQDDRKFTPEQLSALTGKDIDEAKRILDFAQGGSNSHSAWLTFMFPRLYVAKELLREDGVIFISIDDNEQAQLKLLCDEVFGEENFLTLISRSTGTPTGGGGLSAFVNELDYILVYQKTSALKISGLEFTEDDAKIYDKEDEKGRFLIRPLRRTGGEDRREDRPTMYFPLISPDGQKIYPIAPAGYESRWSCGREKYEELRKEGLIFWQKTKGDVWSVYQKFYLDGRTKQTGNLWVNKGGNKKATRETRDIFKGEKIFTSPKPVELVRNVCRISHTENNIILDFFAGSGTTAHAVMALNAEDGGNRKYICVQLDEPTDPKSEARKAGYNTIFEITRERILRAAKKIQEENPEVKCDFGFKEFKTISAGEGQFKGYLDDAQTLEDYTPFNGMALDDEARHALLTTWKVYDGLPLTLNLQEVDLGGYVAYAGEDKLYFTNRGLELKHVVEMLKRIDEDKSFIPRKLVAFHYMFGDKMLKEFHEAVNAPNRKHLELEFIQRF